VTGWSSSKSVCFTTEFNDNRSTHQLTN